VDSRGKRSLEWRPKSPTTAIWVWPSCIKHLVEVWNRTPHSPARQEEAIAARDLSLGHRVAHEPLLAPVRADPRYLALLRKGNLPE
jgi:hypothetical protein